MPTLPGFQWAPEPYSVVADYGQMKVVQIVALMKKDVGEDLIG
jgi:hypothetical protein